VERRAVEIRNELLKARQAEKDFLLGWQAEDHAQESAGYAADTERHVARIREVIAELESANGAGSTTKTARRITEDLVSLKPYVDVYAEDFHSAAAMMGERASARRESFERLSALDSKIASKIEDFRSAAVVVEPLVDDIAIVGQQYAAGGISSARAAARSTAIVVGASVVAAILTGLLLAYALAHQITTSLRELARTAQAIGAGNLTAKAEVRAKDELGTLAATFNGMTGRLRNLVASLEQRVLERERAEAQVRFLAEAGATLAESLEYQATLAKVARLAVPRLADWCVVDVVESEGEIHRVAAAHRDPDKDRLLQQARERPGAWGVAQPSIEVLETGTSLLFAEVTESILTRYATSPERRKLLLEIGIHSGMTVPLRARGRSLGAMTFVSSAPDHVYGPTDLALAEELGRRAAIAIDNARLYGEAQEAIRSRDEFFSIASHELNTPITSLQLMVERLERAPASAEGLAKAVDVMLRQTKRLSTLIDELLSVARIRMGRLHLEREAIDLASIVKDVAERFGEELARAKCQLSVSAPVPAVGCWDRTRLEQVVTNLLTNAIKFGAGNPIGVRVDLGPRDTVRLVVEDHGIGIEPQNLSLIFGRFERAVSSTSYGGLGLGLYIVKEILGALGGSITVESTRGMGSKFTVELPHAATPCPSRGA
jgi:signal transduction histidine kinase/HAMP domain-containing protein